MSIFESDGVTFDEHVVLEKFDGEEQIPENLTEKLHIENGAVVKREFFEQGELVRSEVVEGEDLGGDYHSDN